MPHPAGSFRMSRFALVIAIAGAAATPAWAAQQRSFVKSTGTDANPCTLAFPCRSFNAAIAQTSPGGEVVILDTAGYGPMTIDKSIKIIGPSGVYGGISVLGGLGPPAPPTTGVVINAGDTDVVTLRGLDIAGVPGVAPLPLFGIDVQNVGTLHIEKSSISNFTQETSACINAVSAKPIQIFVNDSFLRECRNGVFINGAGPDDTTRINLVVDNTRIEDMINTVGSDTAALNLNDALVASVRNSVLSRASDGVRASNANAAVHQRVHVIGSQLSAFENAAVETSGALLAKLLVGVETSVISGNNVALRHGSGEATFTSNVIAGNANNLVLCGPPAGSVHSLSLGGGNGSNAIYDKLSLVAPVGCVIITPTQFTGS